MRAHGGGHRGKYVAPHPYKPLSRRPSAVAAGVLDHLAVVGQAAGRHQLHLAAQLGDVAHGGRCTYVHCEALVLLDAEDFPSRLGLLCEGLERVLDEWQPQEVAIESGLVAEACALGRKDETEVRRAARMGMWLSILFGVASYPLFWWSEAILLALGQKPEVAALGQDFLRVAGFGMIPALLVMALKSYLAALSRTQMVLWVTMAALALNVAVNWFLIFGNGGAPELVNRSLLKRMTDRLTRLAGQVESQYAATHSRFSASGV